MSEIEPIAIHTRLQPGAEATYERVHATIPDELDHALRRGGVHSWRIWRSGQDLFHVIGVADFAAMEAHMREEPVSASWAQTTGPLLVAQPTGPLPLRLVWKLP